MFAILAAAATDAGMLTAVCTAIATGLGGGLWGAGKLFIAYLERRDERESKLASALVDIEKETIAAVGELKLAFQGLAQRLDSIDRRLDRQKE